jgi:hypothetical protein
MVVKGSAAHVAANEQLADELGRVVVADDIEGAGELAPLLAAMHVPVVPVEAYFAQQHVKLLFADALHPAFPTPCVAETALFVRPEIIALGEATPDIPVIGPEFRRAFVLAPRPSREVAAYQAAASATLVVAPCINPVHGIVPPLKHRGSGTRVILLGSPQSRAMALARTLADAWHMNAEIVCGLDEAAGQRPESDGTMAARFICDLVRGDVLAPSFAVDLSGGRPGLQLCREVLERLGVPVVTAGDVGLHRSLGLSTLPLTVSTEFQLSEVFRAFALDPGVGASPAFQNARTSLGTDRGWAYIWGFCKRLFETRDPQFA